MFVCSFYIIYIIHTERICDTQLNIEDRFLRINTKKYIGIVCIIYIKYMERNTVRHRVFDINLYRRYLERKYLYSFSITKKKKKTM